MTNQKGYIKATIQLPSNVEAYLKENCTRLLDAAPQLVLDTFSNIMGYPEDMVYDQFEVEALNAILRKFEDEKNGTTRMGIQGVIYGGKYEGKVPTMDRLPDEADEEIKGVVAGIRFFDEVPDDEATLRLLAEDGIKVYHVRVMADFMLDGEMVMVGDVREEECLSFFTVKFNEDSKAEITPITDDSRFLLVDSIWSILEKHMEDESNVKPNLNA